MQTSESVRRLVSGLLAAVMALSILPSGGATATASIPKTAISASRPAQDLGAEDILASKQDGNDGGIPMPLQLSQTQLGFTEGLLENRVTAYMTDLQYLDVLTFEEYASFFPAWVDLDKVEYLTYQQKQSIQSMKESERLAYRASAEAKIDIQTQFIWEATMDGEDYSDKIAFEPESWFIYEATEDQAPMLVCTAKIRWIGEVPIVTTSASSSGDSEMDQLLNQINNSGSAEATRDISQESQEIQDFLYELYKSALD